jgi:hypothetical protein
MQQDAERQHAGPAAGNEMRKRRSLGQPLMMQYACCCAGRCTTPLRRSTMPLPPHKFIRGLCMLSVFPSCIRTTASHWPASRKCTPHHTALRMAAQQVAHIPTMKKETKLPGMPEMYVGASQCNVVQRPVSCDPASPQLPCSCHFPAIQVLLSCHPAHDMYCSFCLQGCQPATSRSRRPVSCLSSAGEVRGAIHRTAAIQQPAAATPLPHSCHHPIWRTITSACPPPASAHKIVPRQGPPPPHHAI